MHVDPAWQICLHAHPHTHTHEHEWATEDLIYQRTWWGINQITPWFPMHSCDWKRTEGKVRVIGQDGRTGRVGLTSDLTARCARRHLTFGSKKATFSQCTSAKSSSFARLPSPRHARSLNRGSVNWEGKSVKMEEKRESEGSGCWRWREGDFASA